MPNTEPTVWSNVLTAIMAVLGALVSLGIISLLPDQMGAIEKAIGAVLMVAGPMVSTWWGRQNSTSLADPKVKLASGRTVALVREDTQLPTPQAMARTAGND